MEKLIAFNDLDEAFAERLHPSVRQDYIESLGRETAAVMNMTRDKR